MGEGAGFCNGIFQAIQLGISIAIIVLIAKIYNRTEENPLEKYDKSQQNPINNTVDNYINKVDYVSSHARFKYCQCGEEILNNICTEEQIISGCFDVSKNSDRLLLRNLEDICTPLKNDIQSKGGYSKAFDLGFDMVHKMALGILIVLIAVGASVVLAVIAEVGKLCCGEGAALIIAPCAICMICVIMFAGLTNFILFIILMVNYYKGTTTGEFLDYYNSTCLSEDEKKSLKSTFDELDSLDSIMTAFVTLNFIGIGLSCISSCLGIANKEKD